MKRKVVVDEQLIEDDFFNWFFSYGRIHLDKDDGRGLISYGYF